MDFEQAKEQKKSLNEKCDFLSAKLNDIAKKYPSKHGMGLISEEGRLSTEYREAKEGFNKAFKELQNFNKWYVKNFKKEIQNERRNRYIKK